MNAQIVYHKKFSSNLFSSAFLWNLNRVADKGHVVVGVEGSEKAAKEFFQDQNLEYKMDAISMAPNVAHVFSASICLLYFTYSSGFQSRYTWTLGTLQ